MTQYYIIHNGHQVGPMDKHMLVNYGLSPASQVWSPGMPGWMPASAVPDLADVLGTVPPEFHSPGYAPSGTGCVPPPIATPKDRIAFGVLALLLGSIGIQYFYVGKVGAGLLTILLSIITCFSIWPLVMFVQGIVVLCGTQEEFERKFVYSNTFFPLF